MSGMKVLRTPEDRFAGLPDFGYPPRYGEVDGLRLAYVETGPADGEPVLLLHGEPSWSFLYRKVMPVLADAGLRGIAADLVGFGRSDKPAEVGDHSFARHVEWIRGRTARRRDRRIRPRPPGGLTYAAPADPRGDPPWRRPSPAVSRASSPS